MPTKRWTYTRYFVRMISSQKSKKDKLSLFHFNERFWARSSQFQGQMRPVFHFLSARITYKADSVDPEWVPRICLSAIFSHWGKIFQISGGSCAVTDGWRSLDVWECCRECSGEDEEVGSWVGQSEMGLSSLLARLGKMGAICVCKGQGRDRFEVCHVGRQLPHGSTRTSKDWVHKLPAVSSDSSCLKAYHMKWAGLRWETGPWTRVTSTCQCTRGCLKRPRSHLFVCRSWQDSKPRKENL